MTLLSGIILTRNEEHSIKECISKLSFCDEVLVIDDGSTDETVSIATSCGAKVIPHNLDSNFAAQRTFGEESAKGKWIFHVDADERVSKELANEIIQSVNDPLLSYSGFFLRRIDTIWGQKLSHGEFGETKLLRLMRKGSGVWKRSVHEVYDTREETYTLKNPLMHYPHQTVYEFIQNINEQSTIHAEANKREGKRSTLLKIVIWPVGKFFANFFLKKGYADGTRGFVAALFMSFHSWLAWSKLWLLQKKHSEK